MKFVTSILMFIVFAPTCLAAGECRDANGKIIEQAQCADTTNDTITEGSGLPEGALAEVNELKVKMRYFKAIGFHKQSKQKRDAIEAIYEENGVSLPDEYKD